jgi:hypothetical protein
MHLPYCCAQNMPRKYNKSRYEMTIFLGQSQSAYEGTWSHGMRSGRGTYMNAQRDVYSGQFHHDTITGYGTMTYANGDVYMGSFVSDKRHGHGYRSRPRLSMGRV